jgi:hypothetical protein
MFTQPGRLVFARRGFRFRRVRWTSAIAATAVFVLLCVVAQGLPPSKDLEAGKNPVAASGPADAPDLGPAASLPQMSDSEQEYANAVRDQVTTLTTSMKRFSDLCARPEIFSEDWRLSLATELAIWKELYVEAQKLQPSARFSTVQGCWVGALGDLNGAANQIAHGLDHSDAEELNVANGAISQSNGRLTECAREVPRFRLAFATDSSRKCSCVERWRRKALLQGNGTLEADLMVGGGCACDWDSDAVGAFVGWDDVAQQGWV